MKRKLVDTDQLLQIGVDRQIKPPFVDGAPFQTARNVGQGFADIRRRELDAIFLKWVRQQTQGLLLDRAFACVRIGRLVVVGLLVLLCDGVPQEGHRIESC